MLTWLHIDSFILDTNRNKRGIVSVWALPVNQHTIRHPKLFTLIKFLPQILHNEQQHIIFIHIILCQPHRNPYQMSLTGISPCGFS